MGFNSGFKGVNIGKGNKLIGYFQFYMSITNTPATNIFTSNDWTPCTHKQRKKKFPELQYSPNTCRYILIMKANEMHYFSNLFDKKNTPRVSDISIFHHQEYLNTVYTQYVFVMQVLLASASVVRMTTLMTANRTCMTNTYCVYTVLRYSWWWTVDMSETRGVQWYLG